VTGGRGDGSGPLSSLPSPQGEQEVAGGDQDQVMEGPGIQELSLSRSSTQPSPSSTVQFYEASTTSFLAQPSAASVQEDPLHVQPSLLLQDVEVLYDLALPAPSAHFLSRAEEPAPCDKLQDGMI
jgi:hypothetical protein